MAAAHLQAPGPAPIAGTARPAPNWLRRWQRSGLSPEAALARFDSLSALAPAELLGAWRGTGLPTGHPLDGLFERLGWQGKRFESEERVHPLVFRPGTALDPGRMPVCLALRWPRLAGSGPARAGFSLLRPLLRARGPAARLARIEFRGSLGAAMIYDRQPIVDHFRRVDGCRLLGLMQTRSALPFFFLLTAEARRRGAPPERRDAAGE